MNSKDETAVIVMVSTECLGRIAFNSVGQDSFHFYIKTSLHYISLQWPMQETHQIYTYLHILHKHIFIID